VLFKRPERASRDEAPSARAPVREKGSGFGRGSGMGYGKGLGVGEEKMGRMKKANWSMKIKIVCIAKNV